MAVAIAYPIEYQTLPVGINLDNLLGLHSSSRNYQVLLITPTRQLQNKNIQTVLVSISNLKDNWDGHGAISPHVNTIDYTEALLTKLPQQFVSDLSEDQIYPNPNGTITIEWGNSRNGIVSLEIGKDRSTFFVQANGEIIYKNNNLLFHENKIPSDLLSYIKEII